MDGSSSDEGAHRQRLKRTLSRAWVTAAYASSRYREVGAEGKVASGVNGKKPVVGKLCVMAVVFARPGLFGAGPCGTPVEGRVLLRWTGRRHRRSGLSQTRSEGVAHGADAMVVDAQQAAAGPLCN